MEVGIFFGSQTGNCEALCQSIHDHLGEGVIQNVSDVSSDDFEKFDLIILATSTWGSGDLQDDWDIQLSEIETANLENKFVAFVGVGDQEGYGETFCDGVGIIYDAIKDKKFNHIGLWPIEGYEFEGSTALRDGLFLGLILDIENQDDLSEKRIKTWVHQLREEMTTIPKIEIEEVRAEL